jgi:HlyD family secretion protein
VAKGRVADAQRIYDKVKNGVDPDKLASAKARLESAKTGLASAKAAYESDRMKTAQAQLDSAQAAVKVLDVQISKLTLAAPTGGTLLSRAAEPGEFVSPGASLFVIADLNRLTITVYVPEDRYGQIKLEQKATVAVDSFPNQTFTAAVTHIANRAEFTPRNVQTADGRKTTVFAIKLSIENPDGKLKPGMPADVNFGR